jgi:hypothetical protein
MRKLIILLSCTLAGLAACDAIVSDIDSVKSGRLDFDKAATIGDTFDSYAHVEQPGTWTESTQRGKKLVSWTANIKTQQAECVHSFAPGQRVPVGAGEPCNLTGTINVTFVILPDDALEVGDAQAKVHASSLNGKSTWDAQEAGAALLQAIYAGAVPHKFDLADA